MHSKIPGKFLPEPCHSSLCVYIYTFMAPLKVTVIKERHTICEPHTCDCTELVNVWLIVDFKNKSIQAYWMNTDE